jgi:catechol 2,3-dioxygenase-like lactoylglutathione lyase family enzyme
MSQSVQQTQLIGTAPYFVVSDLLASVRYYHEVLGFDLPRLWGEPPNFAMPARDGFIFMLMQADEEALVTTNRDESGHWNAYVWIRDADALFAEFVERGAQIAYEPQIMAEYDMKEFAVLDPDGHVIAFGQHYET